MADAKALARQSPDKPPACRAAVLMEHTCGPHQPTAVVSLPTAAWHPPRPRNTPQNQKNSNGLEPLATPQHRRLRTSP